MDHLVSVGSIVKVSDGRLMEVDWIVTACPNGRCGCDSVYTGTSLENDEPIVTRHYVEKVADSYKEWLELDESDTDASSKAGDGSEGQAQRDAGTYEQWC